MFWKNMDICWWGKLKNISFMHFSSIMMAVMCSTRCPTFNHICVFSYCQILRRKWFREGAERYCLVPKPLQPLVGSIFGEAYGTHCWFSLGMCMCVNVYAGMCMCMRMPVYAIYACVCMCIHEYMCTCGHVYTCKDHYHQDIISIN